MLKNVECITFVVALLLYIFFLSFSLLCGCFVKLYFWLVWLYSSTSLFSASYMILLNSWTVYIIDVFFLLAKRFFFFLFNQLLHANPYVWISLFQMKKMMCYSDCPVYIKDFGLDINISFSAESLKPLMLFSTFHCFCSEGGFSWQLDLVCVLNRVNTEETGNFQ